MDKETSGIYKYDTHVHTVQSSICAKKSGAEIVDYYHDIGYSGIIITDHFIGSENFRWKNELNWKKKIDSFLLGYLDAKKQAEKKEFDVLLGMEYCYKNTEFIFTNIPVEQLYQGEEVLSSGELIEVLRWVHAFGGFIIHVHPFRLSRKYNTIRLIPKYTDAVEVFNAENVIEWPDANKQARAYSCEYGLKMTSGSDFHNTGSIFMGGMAFTRRIHSEAEFAKNVKDGNYTLIESEL